MQSQHFSGTPNAIYPQDFSNFPQNFESRVVRDQDRQSERTQIDFTQSGGFLNIDRQNTWFAFLLFGSLLAFTVLMFVICGALPEPYLNLTGDQDTCVNPSRVNQNKVIGCSPFSLETNPRVGILIRGLTRSNQYLKLRSRIFLHDNNITGSVELKLKLNQWSVTGQDKTKLELAQWSINVDVDVSISGNHFYDSQTKAFGIPFQLLYQHQILNPDQLFIVEFMSITQNLEGFANSNIKNISIEASVVNPEFTEFSKGLRAAFLIKSVFALVFFLWNLRKIPLESRVVEHGLIRNLSILLVIFNCPFIMGLLENNTNFLIWLTQSVNLVFPLALLYFWLCVFERGDLENAARKSSVFSRKSNLLLVLLLAAFSLAMYLSKSYNHLKDFTGAVPAQAASLTVLKYLNFFLTVSIYAMIAMRMINIFGKRALLMHRYRVLVYYTILFFGFSLLYFISHQYYVFSSQPKAIFLIISQFNLYTYSLQFLYLGGGQPPMLSYQDPGIGSEQRIQPEITKEKRVQVLQGYYPKASVTFTQNKTNNQKLHLDGRQSQSFTHELPVQYQMQEIHYQNNSGAKNEDIVYFDIGDPYESESQSQTAAHRNPRENNLGRPTFDGQEVRSPYPADQGRKTPGSRRN